MRQRHLDRCLLIFLLAGCAEAKFAGGTPQRAQQPIEPSVICTVGGSDCTPPPPPVAPRCSEVNIGAQLAFLIDNSSSNESTDCPSPRATGRVKPGGAAIFACDGETNREKAVLAAYDLLVEVSGADKANALATSSLGVISFPIGDNAGFTEQQTWTKTTLEQRASLPSAMRFARAPYGKTPYGEALNGAERLFASASSDERQKVAILVTDGFPTDANPARVLQQAEKLRAAGVNVVTISVTGPETRTQRQEEHRAMLAGFNRANLAAVGRSWYDNSEYQSFDSYLDAILSLGQQVAQGQVIEVDDVTALAETVIGVIGKELKCQP